MVLTRNETCFYCGENFNVYGTGLAMACDPCERARARCASVGEGDDADRWIVFIFGAETLRRGRLEPWILRQRIKPT